MRLFQPMRSTSKVSPLKFSPHAAMGTPICRLYQLNLVNLTVHIPRQGRRRFDWAVYSFSNGHFSSTVQSHSLPFHICLACDRYESGQSLFHEFATIAKIFNSGNDFLQHIRASGDTSVLHGYLINSYRFQTSEVTTSFWKVQLSIIAQLCLIWLLSIVLAIIIPDHNGSSISAFQQGLTSAHWKVSSREVSYTEIGDSVANSCTIIIAIHSSFSQRCQADLAQDSPFSDTTANHTVHLGAFQLGRALAQP